MVVVGWVAAARKVVVETQGGGGEWRVGTGALAPTNACT